MGRPKVLTDEQRVANRKASKAKWQAENAEQRKAYRERTKAGKAATDKAYRERNAEKIREQGKRNREAKKTEKAEYDRKYREANREKLQARRKEKQEKTAEYMREWRKRNKERLTAYNAEYSIRNKSRRLVQYREYNAAHGERGDPAKKAARTAYRRATKLSATPVWFGELDEFVMQESARLAKKRSGLTGFKWHVDHIVPLQTKLVCGLHASSNIAVIPAESNLSKSNRWWTDMP